MGLENNVLIVFMSS